MRPDFIDSILREINTGFDKMSSKISEAFEINKIRGQIEELARERKNKLAELGSLTFRKINQLEHVPEEEINKIVDEIKAINDKISSKKEELDKKVAEASQRQEELCKECVFGGEATPICPNCKVKIEKDDRFCRNCGHSLVNPV